MLKLRSHKQSVSCDYLMCLLKTYFFLLSIDIYNTLKNTTCIICRKTLMPTSKKNLHLSIHISPEYVFPAVNMIIALELLKVMSNNIGPKYFNCTLCNTRVHTKNINKCNIWDSKNKMSSPKTLFFLLIHMYHFLKVLTSPPLHVVFKEHLLIHMGASQALHPLV